MNASRVRFSTAKNEKIDAMNARDDIPFNIGGIATFSLSPGVSCPDALECLAKVYETEEGKAYVVDGKHAEFRCFAATMAARQTSIRHAWQRNFEALRQVSDPNEIADILEEAWRDVPRRVNLIRVHVSGDFFNLAYLRGWYEFARRNPSVHLYAYTKSLRFVVATLGECPNNFRIIASRGGRSDQLIDQHGLREARVVYSEAEAEALGLEIDHDDSLAAFGSGNFALLIHGTQARGTKAAEALKLINREKRAA